MKFKSFILEAEIDRILESSDLAGKLKKFESISNKINYKEVDNIFKSAAALIKHSNVNNSRVEDITGAGIAIIHELEEIEQNLKDLQDELKTTFFSDIIELCKKLAVTVFHHTSIQKDSYIKTRK